MTVEKVSAVRATLLGHRKTCAWYNLGGFYVFFYTDNVKTRRSNNGNETESTETSGFTSDVLQKYQ